MSSNSDSTIGFSSGLSVANSNLSELFVTLFETDKNRLYAYIYAYVLDYAAADDIFQETSMTLWREFKRFEQGSSFSKWANGIAFNRIRTYRHNRNKYKLGVEDDIMQELADVISETDSTESSSTWLHLKDCSSNLSAPLKKIYNAFYIEELKAKEIADHSGRSIYAIRKAIHKLRKVLFDCVEQKVKEDSK